MLAGLKERAAGLFRAQCAARWKALPEETRSLCERCAQEDQEKFEQSKATLFPQIAESYNRGSNWVYAVVICCYTLPPLSLLFEPGGKAITFFWALWRAGEYVPVGVMKGPLQAHLEEQLQEVMSQAGASQIQNLPL